ncbi:MAG: hypothetical protein AAB380_00705 [Verrucomicrobiota bacterium]
MNSLRLTLRAQPRFGRLLSVRISIGEKSLAKGEVEIKPRGGVVIPVKIDDAVARVVQMAKS